MEPLHLYYAQKRNQTARIYGGRIGDLDEMTKDLMVLLGIEEEELCPNCGNVLKPCEADSKTGLCDTCDMQLDSELGYDEGDNDYL